MNEPLPKANPNIAAEVRDWLDRFAVCVRDVDYAAARPFWHPDIVIFGTYQELVKSLPAWTELQWDNVWPRTAEFRFDLKNTIVLASPDGAMAVAIAPWTSTGFHVDGRLFDRPGRATIVLARQHDGRWLGVHSHMSTKEPISVLARARLNSTVARIKFDTPPVVNLLHRVSSLP